MTKRLGHQNRALQLIIAGPTRMDVCVNHRTCRINTRKL